MAEHGVNIVVSARDEASEKLGNIQRNFMRLGGALIGFKGVQAAEFGIVAGYRAWQVEQAKVSGNYTDILGAELKLNDALRDTVRSIPYIGKGIAAMMEAFGNDEQLKNSIKLFEHMQTTIEQAKKDTEDMLFNAKIMAMQAAGRPQSEIEAAQFERIGEGRQKTLEALKEELKLKQKNLQIEIERVDAERRYGIPTTLQELKTGLIAPPNRSEIEKLREKVAELQKQIAEREKAVPVVQAAEEQRLKKVRADEEEKRKTEAKKRFDWNADQEYKLHELNLGFIDNKLEREKAAINLRYDEELKRAKELGYAASGIEARRSVEFKLLDKGRQDWEKSQQDEITKMNLGFIKDKTQRETAAINLRYDREIQKAKELGMNTDLIERQRSIALELAGMGGGKSDRRPAFDERNMFRFGNGEGGSAMDWTQKTAANTEKIAAGTEKTTKAVTDLYNWLRTRPPNGGSSMTPSSFY